jgi:hypothetical protein
VLPGTHPRGQAVGIRSSSSSRRRSGWTHGSRQWSSTCCRSSRRSRRWERPGGRSPVFDLAPAASLERAADRGIAIAVLSPAPHSGISPGPRATRSRPLPRRVRRRACPLRRTRSSCDAIRCRPRGSSAAAPRAVRPLRAVARPGTRSSQAGGSQAQRPRVPDRHLVPALSGHDDPL